MFTKTEIEKFFTAEKRDNLLVMLLGIAAIVLSLIGIFYWQTPFWKGAAIPFILIALIQIIVGYTVFARSDKLCNEIVNNVDADINKIQKEELPRIEEINKNFSTYRWTEIILFIAGIALSLVYSSNPDKQLIFGVGVALAIEAAIMFWSDFLSEKRAISYTTGLKAFLQKQNI